MFFFQNHHDQKVMLESCLLKTKRLQKNKIPPQPIPPIEFPPLPTGSLEVLGQGLQVAIAEEQGGAAQPTSWSSSESWPFNGRFSFLSRKTPKKNTGGEFSHPNHGQILFFFGHPGKIAINWTWTTLTHDHQQDLLDTFLVIQLMAVVEEVSFLPIPRPHVVGVKIPSPNRIPIWPILVNSCLLFHIDFKLNWKSDCSKLMHLKKTGYFLKTHVSITVSH